MSMGARHFEGCIGLQGGASVSTESEYPDYVYCQLADHDIDSGDCMENRDVVAGNIMSSLTQGLPEEYAVKENWKEICRNCRWFSVW